MVAQWWLLGWTMATTTNDTTQIVTSAISSIRPVMCISSGTYAVARGTRDNIRMR